MAVEDSDNQSSAPGFSPMGRTKEMTLRVSSSGKKAETEHSQAAAVSPAPGLSLDYAERDTVSEKVQCESLGVEGLREQLCCVACPEICSSQIGYGRRTKEMLLSTSSLVSQ